MSKEKTVGGRTLPQNIEAETFLIASLLIDPRSMEKIINTKLTPHDFYDEKNKLIYDAIQKLIQDNRPIDIITLTDELQSDKRLDKVGGASYISSLIDIIPTSANIEHYAGIVKSKSMLRQLIYVANDIIAKSMDGVSEEAKNLAEEAEKRIFNITEESYASDLAGIKDVVQETIQNIQEMSTRQGELLGVPSGFHELDEVTDGFQDSELIILAARPGMGKTSFGLNILTNAVMKYKKSVGFFSCEMSRYSLVKRMLCSEAEVDQKRMRRGMLSKVEESKLVDAASALYETRCVFDDTPNIPILELVGKARRMKREYNIDMLIIDYLQLVNASDALGSNKPRHEQIGFISQSLKGLARQLDIPVIALAQLNRNIDQRGDDSRPKLSDLRDSGSIEQDADVIMFINRADEQPEDSSNADIREIIVGKNRNGPTVIFKIIFLKNFTKFRSYTKESPYL
jgi:replicative DNA helicase